MVHPEPPQPARWITGWHKPAFIVFLIAWSLNQVLLCIGVSSKDTVWAEGVLLVCAVMSSLVTLALRLPVQNVLMTAGLIAGIAFIITSVGAVSGIPFGPFTYSGRAGEQLFAVVPWSVPLMWVVVIVNARGVARLTMRPWRKTNYYGFWVIGLACALAVLVDLSLEPFAVYVKGYWIWRAPDWVWNWYSAPCVNFLGWMIAALAILTFTTPWLINKNPIKLPMSYHPLVVWVLMNAWLISGNALHGHWTAVVVGVVGNVIVTIFTIRGARW